MPASRLTGSRIRENRLMQGMRQVDLARAVGVSPSYLNLIEHNRRRIGGKVLSDLARALGVEVSLLAEGAEAILLEELGAAGAGVGEVDRVDEFAGRFPGWADLIARQHHKIAALEAQIEVMQDRMTHDPQLSTALHDVISAVTSIRSTSSILVSGEALDADWQSRFHANIYSDSLRLADSSQDVVNYLERTVDTGAGQASPQDAFEAYLEREGFYFAELEQGKAAPDLSDVEGAAHGLLQGYFERYAVDAQALPKARFGEVVEEVGYDPALIAARTGVGFAQVLRRIAALGQGQPVGLVGCDGAGAITLRKQIDGFSMPRLGAPCALWPLFGALSHPMVPQRQSVEMPGAPAMRFTCYSIAEHRRQAGFGGPVMLEATMLILPEGDSGGQAPHAVGSSCRVCPRRECPARREASILA